MTVNSARSAPRPTLTELSDPGWFREGRLAAHSDHLAYASTAELVAGSTSLSQSLNGQWKFHYAKNPSARPVGFEAVDFDCSSWDDMVVPGHLQLQGYDRPQYANSQYPWDGHETIVEGEAPQRYNPVGSYVTSFTMDEPVAQGERITVCFHGAESGLAVWLNGQWLGWSTDTFTPAEFDLTDQLVTGENKLAAQVFKWTAQSWLEDQDFYRFSGLFRDVVLQRRPRAHLRDLRVTTDLNDSFDQATLTVETDLVGEGSLALELVGVGPLTQGNGGQWTMTLDRPRLWSAEDPHLYELIVEVRDQAGELTELIEQPVGVRRFEIVDAVMRINGQRIVFNGVNRHEFGLNGRVMTREQTEADLVMLKRANVNAIRTSHYPNNSFFYELCDQYGFYVIDEVNLETHGMWDAVGTGQRTLEQAVPGDDRRWWPALVDRADSMYERDKNHPCIVMWSLGNESYGGSLLRDLSHHFRALDQSRIVHYEGVAWDARYPETTDVVTQMYTFVSDIEKQLEQDRSKPFMLCEFAHNMGNSFGAVDKYIDLAWRDEQYQGGFIWDFADQAIALKDRYGRAFFGYGGDCGEAPHDSDFSGNGIVFVDRTPKPAFAEMKYLYQPYQITLNPDAGSFKLTNRQLFTDSSSHQVSVSLTRQGARIASGSVPTAVPPLGEGSFALPFDLPTAAGEYVIEVSISHGGQAPAWAEGEIAFEQCTYRASEPAMPAPLLVRPRSGPPELIEGTHNYGVRGEHFQVLFSRLKGGLLSYRYGLTSDGGRELLRGLPTPNFWHAPTSNERGWGMGFRDGDWQLASQHARFKPGTSTTVELVDDRVVVGNVYELPTTPASVCAVSYAVAADGHVQVTVELDPAPGLPDAPEFGLQMLVDPDLDRLRWYGKGPHECYVDRQGSAKLGVHTANVADLLTQYLRPQEAGNRTGVRWAEVTDLHGRGLRLDADTPMDLSVLGYTPAQIEASAHHVDLPPIQHTVLRPAMLRRGVGGDQAWGAMTHEEYRLPADEKLSFTFGFVGI